MQLKLQAGVQHACMQHVQDLARLKLEFPFDHLNGSARAHDAGTTLARCVS